jgi:hypothetical protein
MQLKRRTEIKPADLPYIESAFFAVSKLNSSRHDTFHRILNLDEVLRDGNGLSTSNSGQEEQHWKRLLSRVERGDLLLVCNHLNPPFSPVFRKQARAEGAQGDTYEIHPHHATNPGGLHGLLRYVSGSVTHMVSTGAAVTAGSAASAAAAAVALAAVRSAPEEKRYSLVAALTYQHPGTEKNKITAVRCKLENEFTGPESRRSGEIKKTDPVFTGLRHREMRMGDYTLAFQKHPRAVRFLESKK